MSAPSISPLELPRRPLSLLPGTALSRVFVRLKVSTSRLYHRHVCARKTSVREQAYNAGFKKTGTLRVFLSKRRRTWRAQHRAMQKGKLSGTWQY